MDAPISSDASLSSPPSGPPVDLVERHQQLRARLRWLLPAGGLLLLLLAYQLATYPTRAALGGYRYQQVGVQPDSTWWILAYRAGKAEILFSRDTAQGWQRRELGVDSAQARSLALNWDGKALLVGEGGAVRVYDSLFEKTAAIPPSISRRFQGRWVGADKTGRRAIIIGDSGKAEISHNGGYTWQSAVLKSENPGNWPGHAVLVDDKLYVSSYNYCDSYVFSLTYAPVRQLELGWHRDALRLSTAPGPIIYFMVTSRGTPVALRQDGSAEVGFRHYPPAEVTTDFPAEAEVIDAAFSPTRPGHCLLISHNRVFAGRLSGPFTSAQPTETRPNDSAAVGADSLKLPKNQAGTTARSPGKKAAASTGKAKKPTIPARKKTISKPPLTSKSQRPIIPLEPDNKEPNSPQGNGDNVGQGSKPAQGGKLGPTNPVQQNTAPANQENQPYTPPASDPKQKEATPKNRKDPSSTRRS